MVLLRRLLVALLPLLVAAQNLTSSSSTTSATSSPSTTGSLVITASTSSSTTNATVQAASTTSTTSAALARPTANSTASGTTQTLELWAPEEGLMQCEEAVFAFTGPEISKACGVFVTNTSVYLETISLGGSFTSLTSGTFSWLVDVPAGLSLEVQMWVTLNGAVEQYTLHGLVVQEGESNSCLATNSGQNTVSVISYASALNSSYTYSAPEASATFSSGGSHTGAIAGGVVGGLLGLALLILLSYFFHRRRKFSRLPPPPGVGDYDGKNGQGGTGGEVEGFYTAGPGMPVLTYAQMVQQCYRGEGQGVVAPYQAARATAAHSSPNYPSSPSNPPPQLSEFNPSSPSSAASPTQGLEDLATFATRSSMSTGRWGGTTVVGSGTGGSVEGSGSGSGSGSGNGRG